jgi:hypothetical protein
VAANAIAESQHIKELRPLLDRLLIETQGTSAPKTATKFNELLIVHGVTTEQLG